MWPTFCQLGIKLSFSTGIKGFIACKRSRASSTFQAELDEFIARCDELCHEPLVLAASM